MSLSSLPPELLNEITTLLTSLEIAFLWLCGYGALNWKLSVGGGVTRFVFSHDPLYACVWPRLVSSFPHLQIFEYKEGQHLGRFPPIPLELESLSPKLRALKLESESDFASLLRVLDQHPTAFSDLVHLSVSDYYLQMNLMFPQQLYKLENLRRLTLWPRWTATAPFPSLLLGALPPKLTLLHGRFQTVCITDSAKFPESLTHLHLHLEDSADIFPTLPEGLVTLRISTEHNPSAIMNFDWKQLPPYLKSLSVDVPDTMTKAFVELLPRTLTRFCRMSGNAIDPDNVLELLPYMPKTLTKLEGFLPDPLSVDIIRALPPNLTNIDEGIVHAGIDLIPPATRRLRLQHLDQRIPRDFLAFPKHLTYLSVERIDVELASKIPNTLKHLSLDIPELTAELTAALPRHITGMVFMRNAPFKSEECFKALPRTLVLLDGLPINLHRLIDQPLFHIAALPAASPLPRLPSHFSSFDLPRTLQTLTLGPMEVDDEEWYLHLPPNLSTLKLALRSLTSYGLINISKACPRLRTLDLRLIYAIDSQIKNKDAVPSSPDSHWVAHLPRRLSSFTLSSISVSFQTNITDNIIKRLPRGLTSLDVPNSPLVTAASADFVPKFLRRLYFGYGIPIWFSGIWREEHTPRGEPRT